MIILDYDSFARQVLDVCVGLGSGDRVWINAWEDDTELSSELAWQCMKRDCQVLTSIQYESLWTRSITEAPEELVDKVPDNQASALEETDVYIFTVGPKVIPWSSIPPERHHLVTRWFSEKNKFVEQWKAIAARNRVKMLGLESTLTSPLTAERLGLDYDQWRRVMYDGCMADYAKMGPIAEALAELMGGKGRVKITTPQGTDFAFRLDSRPVDWFDGIMRDEWIAVGRPAFLPAGGIEATADEESGDGTVVFDQPLLSLLKEGRLEGLKLGVANGRITKLSASKNEEAFEKWLTNGSGDSDRFGFFGFGLNPKLRHGFTQDDKVLGGVTIGFGGNSDKGGKNKAGREFWASMTKATVTIGEKVVMRDGRLLIPES